MKPNTLFAVLLIGLTLTVGSAFAQTMTRVAIPFDFNIGNSMLPAGEYTFSRLFAGNSDVLAIRSMDGRQQVVVQTSAAESAKTPSESKLVFRRYGSEFFLSQIWLGGQEVVHVLAVSDHEREMARGTKVQEASIVGK
jgi:hypothetical protein